METSVAVDVGGTWVRAGRASKHPWPPLFEARTPRSSDECVATIVQAIRTANAKIPNASRVVVAFAGLVSQSGFIDKSLNTPLSGVDLKAFVESEFGIETTVRNDSQVQYLGLPKAAGPSALLSWGTGVGGAIGM